MSAPGWYPDPEGRKDHVRFWDGRCWQGEPVRQGGARPGFGTVMAVVIVVVLVAVAAGVFITLRGDQNQAGDAPSPTASQWDEISPSPSPSPSPTRTCDSGSPCGPQTSPNPSQSTAPCVVVELDISSKTDAGRIIGGGLSIEPPEKGKLNVPVSEVLADTNTRTYQLTGTSWFSFVQVGRLPNGSDLKATAQAVVSCHATGPRFQGLGDMTTVEERDLTIDGHPAHWARIHATNDRVPGGGATFDAIAVRLDGVEGLAIYFSGVVDEDKQLLEEFDTTREGLRVTS